MFIIPKGERNIRFVTQPGVGAIGGNQQAGAHHGAILQRHERFVIAKRHLLQLRRSNQCHFAERRCTLPECLMNHLILNDVAKVRQPLLFIVKGDGAEAVPIPHLHAVIAAGA